MPQNPKNFPFYNWVPKPLGIIFLIILFVQMASAHQILQVLFA